MTGTVALSIAQEGGGQTHQKFKGVSRIVGPQWSHFPALTIGLLGVSIFWSVEMSYGMLRCFVHVMTLNGTISPASPYLLSLGLSKSKMAVVFVAGPLSGLVMQPLIGAIPLEIFGASFLLNSISKVCSRITVPQDLEDGGPI
jgi:solute carrier family 45 protein 1/2/4